MVFITPFDPTHPQRLTTGDSAPAAFESVAAAVAVMGEPLRQSRVCAIYPGVAVSSFAFAIDGDGNKRQKYEISSPPVE